MLKKRIIGVVTIRDGLAVQSFGYKRYLPIGKPEIVVENLDRWGIDEILIQVIDLSINGFGVDLELIRKIGSLSKSTPIIYAGGVRSLDDAVNVIQAGADRICVDALLHSNPDKIKEISCKLGAQAVIASFPIIIGDDCRPYWYNYITKQLVVLNKKVLCLLDQDIISEAIIIDCQNEGNHEAFNFKLLSIFANMKNPLILFGGLSSAKLLNKALIEDRVSAVAIGNFLNYREHAVQEFKKQLALDILRSPLYQDKFLVYDN
ncbi:MAG: hypothetical protein LBL17_02405 [Coxiellaceae bacterium]|jgi:cyclase|nr:hypothetical protein [Coxiellaceae bacterium]